MKKPIKPRKPYLPKKPEEFRPLGRIEAPFCIDNLSAMKNRLDKDWFIRQFQHEDCQHYWWAQDVKSGLHITDFGFDFESDYDYVGALIWLESDTMVKDPKYRMGDVFKKATVTYKKAVKNNKKKIAQYEKKMEEYAIKLREWQEFNVKKAEKDLEEARRLLETK